MKQLVLYGAYGLGNLGDKLLADYYRDLLYSVFPDYTRRIITIGDIHPLYPGEIILKRWQVLSWLKTMSPENLWIAGGGSLLQNRTSCRSLLFYISLLELASLCGARSVILGQGYGPVNGRIWTSASRHALSRSELIECRDTLTYEHLQRMLLGNTRIQRGVDPSWTIAAPNRTRKGDKLLLILKQADRYKIPKILAAISRHGWLHRIKVVALDPIDEKTLQKYFDYNFCGTALDTASFWTLVEGVRGLLSSRLHGIILGALVGLPAIGLGDDPKIVGICKALGFTVNSLEGPEDYEALPLMIAELDTKTDLRERVQRLKEQAQNSRESMKLTLYELGERI